MVRNYPALSGVDDERLDAPESVAARNDDAAATNVRQLALVHDVQTTPSMFRLLRTLVLFGLIGSVSAPTWAACLQETPDAPMKCCTKVQQQACPQMDLSRLCCTTGRPASRESTAARLEGFAGTAAGASQSHVVFATWMSHPRMGSFSVTATVVNAPPLRPHLVNSVLLI